MAPDMTPELALLNAEYSAKLPAVGRELPRYAGPSERIFLLDALRGFALLGLLLVHCAEYFELYWRHPEPSHIHNVVGVLFAGKAYAVFALLFGVSFFLIMKGSERRQVEFSGRFAWRLLVLMTIGYLYSLAYVSEILQALGVLGLSLLIFNRFSNRALLILSVIFLVEPQFLISALLAADENQIVSFDGGLYAKGAEIFALGSFWDVVRFNLWDGQLLKWAYLIESARISSFVMLFIWGLLLGRIGFFAAPEHFLKQRRQSLLLAGGATLLLHSGKAHYDSGSLLQAHGAAKLIVGSVLENWGALATAMTGVLLFIEAFSLSCFRRVLLLFAPCGRMSLTIYVGQGLLGVPLFYGYGVGWYRFVDQEQALAFGLSAFAAMSLFAHLWMQRFRYGPLEWLWRCGTYLSFKVPLRHRVAA